MNSEEISSIVANKEKNYKYEHTFGMLYFLSKSKFMYLSSFFFSLQMTDVSLLLKYLLFAFWGAFYVISPSIFLFQLFISLNCFSLLYYGYLATFIFSIKLTYLFSLRTKQRYRQ